MQQESVQSELRKRSYTEEDMAKALQKQILIMPQLIVDDTGKSQLVRGDVSDVKKVLAQAGYETEVVLDKGLMRRELVQKDAGIVLPLILFAVNIPLTVATSYIANWLFARFTRDQKTSIKYEHARFGPDGKMVDYIKLEGEPRKVAEILKSGKFRSTDDNTDTKSKRRD
jgi:hypothetical protein